MRRVVFQAIAGIFLASASVGLLAQDFKPYPGAKHDEQVSQHATAAAPGKQVDVYLTSDDFDKVCAFYKDVYKEYTMPRRKGSSGQPKMAFFLIDGAADLGSSKYWAKVQRPYLDEGGKAQELTVIQTIRSK